MPTNTQDIREIILHQFSDEDLRDFCFDNYMPVYDQFADQMTKTTKAQRLIEFCYRSNRLEELGNLIHQQQQKFGVTRDIPTDFVNREEEKREALRESSSPYMLFDAPTGYGKTRFLQAIRDGYFARGWYFIFVETPQDATAFTLSLTIIHELLVEHNKVQQAMGLKHFSSSPLTEIPFIVNNFITLIQLIQSSVSHKQTLVILIDNIEQLRDEEVDIFESKFLKPLHQELETIQWNLLVRLSGRDVRHIWLRTPKSIIVRIKQLTPFRYEDVLDTLYAAYRSKKPAQHTRPNRSEVNLCAAYLMYLTGGHPGCMKQIIEQIDFEQPVEAFFNHERERLLKENVLPIAHDIRATIPDGLRDMFDVLSVFRLYNLDVLQKMIDTHVITFADNADILEQQLTATRFVKMKADGFIQDDIVSRILAIRLRWEEPERFFRLSNEAKTTFKEYLAGKPHNPAYIVREALHQEILSAFCVEEQSLDERRNVRTTLLADDGKVHWYIEQLQNCSSSKHSMQYVRHLLALLEDEQESWEFRLLANFMLREETYNDAPFNDILDKIRKFLPESEGV